MKKETIISGAEGRALVADMHLSDIAPVAPLVIYAHGFSGFKDWGNGDLLARYFNDAGLHFLKFNFSHNGTTPDRQEAFADPEAFGHNNFTKQLTDLDCLMSWIHDEAFPFRGEVDLRNIVLIGHSMGGGTAVLYTASDHRISQLITWASVGLATTPWGKWDSNRMLAWKEKGVECYTNSRTGQNLPLYYQLYEDYCNYAERLDIPMAAGRVKVPWLICHGKRDVAVLWEVAAQLHREASNAELFLMDADHTFGRVHPWQGKEFGVEMSMLLEKSIGYIKAHIRL